MKYRLKATCCVSSLINLEKIEEKKWSWMLLCRRLMNILSMIKVITKQTYTTYCLAYVTQLNTMKKWFIRLCFWCICWLIVFCITRNRTQGLRLVETHLLKNSYLFALVRYFWKWFCAKCCLFACLTTMNRKKKLYPVYRKCVYAWHMHRIWLYLILWKRNFRFRRILFFLASNSK